MASKRTPIHVGDSVSHKDGRLGLVTKKIGDIRFAVRFDGEIRDGPVGVSKFTLFTLR